MTSIWLSWLASQPRLRQNKNAVKIGGMFKGITLGWVNKELFFVRMS